MAVVKLLVDLSDNVQFVIMFAIVSKIVDKRITGMHITLLASLINQTSFAHKFYIYDAVEQFGLFIPQCLIAIMSMIVTIYMEDSVLALDNAPVEDWQVSSDVIEDKKNKKKD